MKTKLISIIKCIIFLSFLVFSLIGINRILMPKYCYSNSEWPTTSTFSGFYQMERNTVDVIILGSSVAASAFNPQEIYDSKQIRSYNLACEQQSPVMSYYWLKEALSCQSPKAVIFDLRFVFPAHQESPLNATEPMIRKNLDAMRFSPVKKEAVNDICRQDDSQDVLSYYLTNLRFHSRWVEMDASDFSPEDYVSSPLKGYSPLTEKGPKEFQPLEVTGEGGYALFDQNMLTYLDRIEALCREKGIALILTSMADTGADETAHNTMQRYADEHGISLYDFSEKGLYEEVGARLRKENITGHPNIWGSAKLSRFMAGELSEKYGISGTEDAQWENSRPFYEHVLKSCELTDIDDIGDYFSLLRDRDYTVFIVAKGEPEGQDTGALSQAMASSGLTDPSLLNGKSYIAVLTYGEEPVEMLSGEALSYNGSLGNGRSVYSLKSAGLYAGNRCSVSIDGREYAKGESDMFIVVYDNLLKKIVDVNDLV